MSREEHTDCASAMSWTTVPGHVDRAAQMTREVAAKGLEVEAGEVVRSTPGRAPPADAAARPPLRCTPRADRGGTGGGCAAAGLRRPGPPQIGDEQEPRLIGAHEMGADVDLHFVIRSHSSRVQRAIASSSHLTARGSGFWQTPAQGGQEVPDVRGMIAHAAVGG